MIINHIYCTDSQYKREEWTVIATLPFENKTVGDNFHLEFRSVPTEEPLLCNLVEMVRVKATSAYRQALVPCLVEHAGIVLEPFLNDSFPGGLTQPMWDALGAKQFVASCKPLAIRAMAQAVVGYCDGMNVYTFRGETWGMLSEEPKGEREFYWDTIFCPDGFGGKTYAEIVGPDVPIEAVCLKKW